MMIGKGNLFVGVIILIGMLWGCRSKPAVNQDTLNSGVIRIAVDATLFPLLDAELAVFEALTPAAGIPLIPMRPGRSTCCWRTVSGWLLLPGR